MEYLQNLSNNNNFPLTLENPFHFRHGFFVRVSFTCHFRHVFHGWKMNSIITCEKCYSNIYRNTLWIINYFYWVPLLVQLRWLFEVCSAAPFSNMIDFPFAVDFLEKSTKIIYTHTHTQKWGELLLSVHLAINDARKIHARNFLQRKLRPRNIMMIMIIIILLTVISVSIIARLFLISIFYYWSLLDWLFSIDSIESLLVNILIVLNLIKQFVIKE